MMKVTIPSYSYYLRTILPAAMVETVNTGSFTLIKNQLINCLNEITDLGLRQLSICAE